MGSEGKMEWHYESWRDNYTFPHCERSIEYIENLDRSPHTHVHYNIELLYIIEGNMRLNLYEGNQIFHSIYLSKNDVILINCNIIHNTVAVGRVRYYLAFIPPDSLMSPLHIELGKTCSCGYNDSDLWISQMLDRFSMFSGLDSTEVYNGVLCTSLANAIIAYLMPRLQGGMMPIRGSSLKSDILTYVYKNYRNPELSAEMIAKNFGYSRRYISSIFSDNIGSGVKSYITLLRINDAKNLLETTSASVESISYEVGFDCPRTFFRVFKAHTGTTPTAFRESSRK